MANSSKLLIFLIILFAVSAFGRTDDDPPKRSRPNRSKQATVPIIASQVPTTMFYVPVSGTQLANDDNDDGSVSNATVHLIDETLKSRTDNLTNDLDAKMTNKTAAVENKLSEVEEKLSNSVNGTVSAMDLKLKEYNASILNRILESENSIRSSIESLHGESKQLVDETNNQTSDLKTLIEKSETTMQNSLTSLRDEYKQGSTDTNNHIDDHHGKIMEKLNALEASSADMMNLSKLLCRTGGNGDNGGGELTLALHHERMHDEIKSQHDLLLNEIRESLRSAMNDLKVKNRHEAQVDRDEDIKQNLDVRIEAADEENPNIGKLLPLTPIVAARKLRQLWNANMGKGMVAICYHNQPRPISDGHPLADNDDPSIRSIFNGTMDSAHDPQNGPNLNVPNYINSLLMEVRSLDRPFVSLCLENPEHDVEFYHASSCMNLMITKKPKN